MTFIEVLLVAELTVIGLFLTLYFVGWAWNWVDQKVNPRYPHCHIDPLFHPAFVWDKKGNGWIGNVLVIRGWQA